MSSQSLYRSLLGVSVYYLYFLTLIFLIMVMGGWWYVLYAPQCRSHERLNNSVEQMHQQVITLKRSEREMANLDKNVVQLKSSVQNYSHKQSRKQFMQNALTLVADSAHQIGMTVNACRLCTERDASWCTMNEIAAEYKGTLDQIISFFDQLKKTKRIMQCSKCEMTRIDKELFSVQAVFTFFYV